MSLQDSSSISAEPSSAASSTVMDRSDVEAMTRSDAMPANLHHAAPAARNRKQNNAPQILADRNTHLRVPMRLGAFDVEDEQTMEAASLDGRLIEFYHAAHDNAPRGADGEPLQWMSIRQASLTFRLPQAVVANWANRGYIATLKGPASNAHRLVHLSNILAFMQECILRDVEDEIPEMQDEMNSN